jgi:hypothetical protein
MRNEGRLCGRKRRGRMKIKEVKEGGIKLR